MKRILAILCALLVFVGSFVPVCAWSDTPLLVDEADLLTQSEEEQLQSKLESISGRLQTDIAVVTVSSLYGKTPQEFADDFYDENGYADDGILLLISIEDSDWYVSTSGFGITAITDAGLDYMADRFVGELSEGDYYQGFSVFADLCDEFVARAKSGDPYDSHDLPKSPFGVLKNLAVSFVVALVIAFIVTGVMRSKLKTVVSKHAAKDYVKQGSMNLINSRDLFLYSHIDRRAKPKSSNSSGTHTSSSGRTHGGGGGKF